MPLGKNIIINFYSYLLLLVSLTALIFFENYFKLILFIPLIISFLIFKNFNRKLKLYDHTLFLIKNKKIYKCKNIHFNDLCSLTILIILLKQEFKIKKAIKIFLLLKRKSTDNFEINFVR